MLFHLIAARPTPRVHAAQHGRGGDCTSERADPAARSIGDDACPEKGRIVEVGSEPENFLTVQSGPGEAPFREIGRLRNGDMVVVCEKLGLWLGVVYGSATLGCRTTILLPVEQAYTGPCDHGWVMARNVTLDPSKCSSLRQPPFGEIVA